MEDQPPSQIGITHLPLRTRDALYGGPTEAMRLHYRVKEGEETTQFIDGMSLYPWVCKCLKFHVSHPTIHLDCGDVQAILAKEGIVRCMVLPPRDLYHPVYHTGATAAYYSVCVERAPIRALKGGAVTRRPRRRL